PSARAASSRARLVRLLDPGGRTAARNAPIGSMDREEVKVDGRNGAVSGRNPGCRGLDNTRGERNFRRPGFRKVYLLTRNTATMFSTGTTNRRLSPSKSTGIASLGLKSTRSYWRIG